jgi:predicted homoserine dehydrogenase-like protein
MAYGDQPALIAEMVDWARSAGFSVIAAGKGTKYLPAYHAVTPDGVWEHYGLTPAEAKHAGMNSLPRRHKVGHRDGGGRQCLRPRRAV